MENQMEKKVEDEMATAVILVHVGYVICRPNDLPLP